MSQHIEFVYKPQGATLEAYILAEEPRTFIQGPLGCLPASGEFLTPTGWKRMDTWQEGDLVGVWADGVVRFEAATFVNLPASESFIRFATDSLVMELSPEHRVPYYDYRGAFQVARAGDIAEHPSVRRIPTTFSLERPDAPITDAEIRLRVMIAADGCYPKTGKQCFVCVRKPRKVQRVGELLDACGISYDMRSSDARPTEKNFVFQRPGFEKSLDFVWSLSTRQLGVVLEEAMLWDGLANHEERRFFTTVPSWADAIQFAAHATGVRATIRTKQEKEERWKPSIAVYIRKPGSNKNSAVVRNDSTRISRVSSADGRKYCFNTSTGFFIARCEGSVFITGNSGKTNASCWKVFRGMCNQEADAHGIRRSRWAGIRNTYPDLTSTTIKDWRDMFGDLGRYVGGGLEPPTHYLKFDLGDGTTVEAEMVFIALDRPEHERKLRGLQLTGAWLNEVKELSFAIISMLDLRVGRYPKDVRPTWYGIFGDTNAPDTDHWYYKLAEEDKPEGWRFLRQPGGVIADGSGWRLNPDAENLRNLPRGYYERGMQGKKHEWIKVNLANEYGFVIEGRPIYSGYSGILHCRPFELNPRLPLLIGMDFGLTPAAVFGQRSVMGVWRIRSELVATSMGAKAFAREIKSHVARLYPGFEIGALTGDPAGDTRAQTDEITPFQILRSEGIVAKPAPTNDFLIRVEAVDSSLGRLIDGEPGLQIHPDCKVLVKAMAGGYCYKRLQVSGERFADRPDKNQYSHVAEALQYELLGGGEHREVMGRSRPAGKRPSRATTD